MSGVCRSKLSIRSSAVWAEGKKQKIERTDRLHGRQRSISARENGVKRS